MCGDLNTRIFYRLFYIFISNSYVRMNIWSISDNHHKKYRDLSVYRESGKIIRQQSNIKITIGADDVLTRFFSLKPLNKP
jgi:hypothetical protein